MPILFIDKTRHFCVSQNLPRSEGSLFQPKNIIMSSFFISLPNRNLIAKVLRDIIILLPDNIIMAYLNVDQFCQNLGFDFHTKLFIIPWIMRLLLRKLSTFAKVILAKALSLVNFRNKTWISANLYYLFSLEWVQQT
jgi:hypothetical protein